MEFGFWGNNDWIDRLSSSVKQFGDKAVYNCDNLYTITFQKGTKLEEIKEKAFDLNIIWPKDILSLIDVEMSEIKLIIKPKIVNETNAKSIISKSCNLI